MILAFVVLLAAAQSIITDVSLRLYPNGISAGFLNRKTPVSFGMPFVRGDVPAGERVALFDAAAGVTHDAQLDCLATFAGDGSCRHGVVTALFDENYVGASEVKPLLVTSNAAPAPAAKTLAQAVARLQALGVAANASFSFGSETYFFDAIVAAGSGGASLRLAGHLMNEIVVRDWPRHATTGAPHDRIEVQLAARVFYGNVDFVHFDFMIENERMSFSTGAPVRGGQVTRVQASPLYSMTLEVGETSKTLLNLEHHYGTRYHRQVFWPIKAIDKSSLYYVTHNMRCWSTTRAIPSYDYEQRTPMTEAKRQQLYANWLNTDHDVLELGIVTKNMGSTGGRPDIGLLPAWTAEYIFHADDYRMWEIMINCADVGGIFDLHWKHTNGDWVDIEADDLITANVGAYGHQIEAEFTSPTTWDCSHQPSFSYVPFLLSGSKFYEDEMAHYAITPVASANPGKKPPATPEWRQRDLGIVTGTARGQAWCWRQLAHAALYLPDAHPMRAPISRWRDNTVAWWNSQKDTNPLGYFTVGAGTLQSVKFDPTLSSDVYSFCSPWQHDFLVAVVQHAYELHLPSPSTELKAVRDFIANFTVNRFHSKWSAVWDRSYGAPFHTAQQSIAPGNPFYQTMAELWFHSFEGDNLKVMDGLGDSGSVNPTSCGYCYPYGARGTLKLLNASLDVFDVTDAAEYVSGNLDLNVGSYKWSFAGVRQQHPYAQVTAAPTPSPTPPTLPPPTSQPTPLSPTAPPTATTTPQPTPVTNTRQPTPSPPSPSPTSAPPLPPTPAPGTQQATTDDAATSDAPRDWLPWLIGAAALVVVLGCGALLVGLCVARTRVADSSMYGRGGGSRGGSRSTSRRSSNVVMRRHSSVQYMHRRASRGGSAMFVEGGSGGGHNPVFDRRAQLGGAAIRY